MIEIILLGLLVPAAAWTIADMTGIDFKRFVMQKLFYEEESS